ncbi:MAG: DedA family protein [Patescibacteria group bacterium]
MHILTTFSEPLIYFIAFGVIFAETGILACFFFPGDTFLFSLGIFAQQGIISIQTVIIVLVIAAVSGNILGYYLGSFVRSKHHSSRLLSKIPEKYVVRTEEFYRKYGVITVLISRFIPVVRTVAPFLAGVSRMKYKQYFLFSIIGGVLWTVLITAFGYIFGGYVSIKEATIIAVTLMIVASILTPLLVYVSKRYLQKS